MSEMANMAVVYDRVKQAMLDSGEVVSAKDYERLVKCCSKMVEILETCVHRSEGAKDMSFARDVRVYMNIVKDMIQDPFFSNAKFHMQDARKESLAWAEKWEANREAFVRTEKEKPKRRGPKSKFTPQQRLEKLRKYQRDYQKKLREKKKAQKLGLQQFEIVDGKLLNPSEAMKKAEFAKQQRVRKALMVASVKAKMKQLTKKKDK